MPKRIQLSRKKGWRMPANAKKVDRSTRWGNPYHTHGDGYPMDKAHAVALFRKALREDFAFLAYVRGKWIETTVEDIKRELRGKDLACWCPLDEPCHADVLLELANQ